MQIIWSEEALISLGEIIDYLSDEWSVKEVDNFLDRVDEVTINLKGNPQMGMPHEQTKYRKYLVTKQTYLFYHLDNEFYRIYLDYFWNNYQNPEKLGGILLS